MKISGSNCVLYTVKVVIFVGLNFRGQPILSKSARFGICNFRLLFHRCTCVGIYLRLFIFVPHQFSVKSAKIKVAQTYPLLQYFANWRTQEKACMCKTCYVNTVMCSIHLCLLKEGVPIIYRGVQTYPYKNKKDMRSIWDSTMFCAFSSQSYTEDVVRVIMHTVVYRTYIVHVPSLKSSLYERGYTLGALSAFVQLQTLEG